MTIPVSFLFDVSISISPNATGTNGYGPLLFATPEFTPVAGEQPIQVFNSMSEVEDNYTSGEIYNAASTYYSQKPKPKTFVVASIGDLGDDAAPATLVGTLADIDTLNGITAGSLSFTFDGDKTTTDDVDLSACEDFDAVVDAIAGVIPTGCTISQADGVFSITTTASGASETLTYCDTGDLAEALGFTVLGGKLTNGSDGTTIATYLTNALDTGQFFYFVAVDRQYRDTSVMEDTARWCEANGKFYGYASNDVNMLTAGLECQAKDIAGMNLMRTLMNYSAKAGEYPEVSACGRLSTVNFNQAKSTITLAYKDMPEITAANINTSQLSALQAINSNVFMNSGGVGIYYDGRMADGTWADTVQGVDWLTNQIQTNIFNLEYQSTTKIPFDGTGVAMVNQAVGNGLRLGVTNGLIGPGYDSEGVFYPKGYLVQSTPIEDLLGEKGSRIWQGTSFIAIGTGALQGATISGTFVQ